MWQYSVVNTVSHDRDDFRYSSVKRQIVGKFQGEKPKLKIKCKDDRRQMSKPCCDATTDLNLSCVFRIELQGLIPLPICPPWFQHGLQFLVVTG